MALAWLLAITLICIGWSLWIRRVTWTCRWEVAATLNIALQGAAVLLMSPWASSTIGVALHELTGKWNLEDYLGHDCYVVAASAIVYNALGRLADDDLMQLKFKQYVERPATLCIPLLLTTFTLSAAANTYYPDFFDATTDFWLRLYWLILCGTLIHLLLYASRALLVLRKDPRSRRIANVYLVSSVCGVTACVVKIITAFVPALQAVEGGFLVWMFACLCGAGFALASAHSWRQKVKWLNGAVLRR